MDHQQPLKPVLVSRAPFSKLASYKTRMNWTVPWFSSFGSDFNYDLGVTNEGGEQGALSVFLLEGERILHSYSTSDRGVDILLLAYNYLDPTPLGRQEEWEERVNASVAPEKE